MTEERARVAQLEHEVAKLRGERDELTMLLQVIATLAHAGGGQLTEHEVLVAVRWRTLPHWPRGVPT